MTPEIAFDALLVIALLGVAFRALFSSDLFAAIVLYIAFGLLMALAWVRLRAPDIALAEAAIGAGLTGALLIDATRRATTADQRPGRVAPCGALTAAIGAAMAVLLFAGIATVGVGGGLSAEAASAIAESGVQHPVTAVLLNFRAYDTWLETGVLVLAVLGAFAAAGDRRITAPPATEEGEVTDMMLSIMVPAMVLVAGLLLWLGTRAPGGAFQAGAVIGSAGVVLLLLSRWRGAAAPSLTQRMLLASGFAAFLLAALLPLAFARSLLEFRAAQAGLMIVLVEVAITITVATALALLFAAARAAGGSSASALR